MANVCYDNFFLSNEIEDQYQSHLDLQQFCTVDNNLTGVAGMVRKIHKYKATDGTEKLAMGAGNTKTIDAGYTEKEYRIQMAQNRFQYYDEEAMTDPMVITTGTQHAGTDILCVSAGQEIFNGLDFLAFAPTMKLVLGWCLNIVFDFQKITFFIKFQFRGPGSCLCNTDHPFRGSHHTG